MMLNQYPVTFLTGLLVDQAALIGVINTLFDQESDFVFFKKHPP